MLHRFLTMAVLVAAFFFPVVCPAASPMQEVRISTWSDGDTARLGDGRRLRLIGLDTPEVDKNSPQGGKKPGKRRRADWPAGYFGQEALTFVRDLTKGVPVRILEYGEPENRTVGHKPQQGDLGQHDRFGRLLAEVMLPDGRSLNEELLRQGMGFYYPHKGLPTGLRKRLLLAQRQALKERKGCWEKILALPQAAETYIGNRKSERFFSQGCLEKAQVKKNNQVFFQNLEEAFKAGYAPARDCGIWPPASELVGVSR